MTILPPTNGADYAADQSRRNDTPSSPKNEQSTLVPFLADTDSYKLSHFSMYPDSQEMTAYFTFRGPLDPSDHRIVFAGSRHLYEEIFSREITWDDIRHMDKYTATHLAGGGQFPWPRDLWVKIVEDYNGYVPLTVSTLRDGETVYPQIPCIIIKAKRGINGEEFEKLLTWFETQIMRVWNMSTTATKSAHVYEFLSKMYDTSVEDAERWRLAYNLHDFGSRGVSSRETAITSGVGHLMVFDGSDNIVAAITASQWNGTNSLVPLDNGRGKRVVTTYENVGQSVVASEHSVMTAWPDERQALARLIEITPEGSNLSCVSDTYDYKNMIWKIIPEYVDAIRAKNIHFVVRPDSGDPVECVLEGLRAMDACFGSVVNSKGFRVITGAGVIQGDGIDTNKLKVIARAVEAAGYSAQCVVYGMGGGLLQKQNRDTLQCAIKLCERVTMEGHRLPIMKAPKTDTGKGSLPGNMQVNLVDGIPTIFPSVAGWGDKRMEYDLLETCWDFGPVDYKFETFAQTRERVRRTWDRRPAEANVISNAMQDKYQTVLEKIRE